MAEKTELIVIESPLAVFTQQGLDAILEKIAEQARAEVPDLTTGAGRKRIASNAYRVARSKTALDAAGKELVAGWKDQAAKVDEERRRAREFLDALAEEVRRPLTEWEEAEERRVSAIRARIDRYRDAGDAAGTSEDIMSVLRGMDAPLEGGFDEFEEEAKTAHQHAITKLKLAYHEAREAERLAAEEEQRRKAEAEAEKQRKKEEAEKAMRERDERISREAAAREQAKAQLAAEEERRKQEAEKLRLGREALEAERRAKAAEERAATAVRIERARAEAVARQAEEAKKAREADREHRGRVNREAASAIASALSRLQPGAAATNTAISRAIIEEIARGNVPCVTINY